MRGLKVGFYEELDELRKDYGEADFGFLENEKVTKEDYAFDFLHGSCDEFAAMLNEMYGYPIECVRYPGDETVEGKLIHAYCVTDLHGEKAYIDIRGITTDPVLFYEEFENELTYFPEDGSIYTLDDEGYEVEAKIEHWDNKEVLFDGDYESWTDEEIKGFIEGYREYYDVERVKEMELYEDERIVLKKRTDNVELVHITTVNRLDSIRKNGILASEYGDLEIENNDGAGVYAIRNDKEMIEKVIHNHFFGEEDLAIIHFHYEGEFYECVEEHFTEDDYEEYGDPIHEGYIVIPKTEHNHFDRILPENIIQIETNVTEKLYRFMLAFDGEMQDVGVLQGLEDTGIDFTLSEELYEPFEELPSPLLETPDDSPVECWFTEKGLLKFADALNDIIYELSCLNWQVTAQVIEESRYHALYADDYQIAFASSYLETDKTKYTEVVRIQESEPYIISDIHLYYHVTLMENVPSIRKNGLLPQVGERSEELGETEEAIYLFPSKEDMDNALMNWLGEWYNEKYREDCDLAILEVRLPKEISVIDEEVGYEVVYKEKIPAECIRYFDEMGKELDNERSRFRVMKPEEIGDIFHVGTMDLSQKSKFSYEGNGLSISNCPDVWCRITEGHTHGDYFQLVKSDMKLLDYYGLTEAEKQEIQEWATEERYVVPGKLYKSIFYGEEGEEYFSLYDSFDAALEEADYEEECVKEVAGLLPTEKLLGQSLVEVELLDIPDIITELYAEQVLEYDGVYWDEVLDEMSYSAPRGVIFNDRIHDFQVVNLTEKERASGLDEKIQEAKKNMVRCSSDKERKMLR